VLQITIMLSVTTLLSSGVLCSGVVMLTRLFRTQEDVHFPLCIPLPLCSLQLSHSGTTTVYLIITYVDLYEVSK